MTKSIRACLASPKSKRRVYQIYYGWNGYEVRRGAILVYCSHNLTEAEAIMLELEMGRA